MKNNTFKYDNHIYPVCGSHKIIKKGTIKKTTEFKEQQYQCKNVGKNLKYTIIH